MASNFISETLHVTKFTSINHGWSSSEWATIKLLQTQEFFFFNNAPQSTAAVNKKRKIFSFLTRKRWRMPSSELTRPLRQFCVCIVRLVLACTVSSCVFAGTPLWNSEQPTGRQLIGGSPYGMSSVILHSSDKLKHSGRCMLVESSSVWDVRFPSSKALGGYSTQF